MLRGLGGLLRLDLAHALDWWRGLGQHVVSAPAPGDEDGPTTRNHVPQLLLRRQGGQGHLGQGAVIKTDHLADGALEVADFGASGGGDGAVGRGGYHRHRLLGQADVEALALAALGE